MELERLLELAGVEPANVITEASEDVKGWTGKDFTQGLNNEGILDKPHFGDLKFMKIGNSDKKDGQYLAVVENDDDGTWMITWVYGWFKDGEKRADYDGSPTLEGFASKRYANEALKYVVRKY